MSIIRLFLISEFDDEPPLSQRCQVQFPNGKTNEKGSRMMIVPFLVNIHFFMLFDLYIELHVDMPP